MTCWQLVAALWGATFSIECLAQPPGRFVELAAESTKPRIAKAASEWVRGFERLEWLIAHESWGEVCDVADELLARPTDGWVAGGDLHLGPREAVNRRLAAMPAAGVTAYRERFDSLAGDWLRRGIERRDEHLLRQVADQAFCSSAGDDALWALGDIALERGDYQAARAAWRRLRPETAGEGGVPYPDSAIELADVRARLAMVSIREGDFARAEREVAEITRLHPDAIGRIGGREVIYATRLAELIKQARQWPPAVAPSGDWPTLLANSRRTNVSSRAVPLTARFEQVWSMELQGVAPQAWAEGPRIYPAVGGGETLFQDATGVHGYSLVDAPSEMGRRKLSDVGTSGGHAGSGALTIERGRAFAVRPLAPARRSELPGSQLVGLDLARDGALVFQQRAEAEGAVFVGPPVVRGSRVAVCEAAPSQGMKASVVCYDLWTGAVVWRRALGWAFDVNGAGGRPSMTMALAEDAGVLHANTNMGMIAAIRIEDGEPLWLRSYARRVTGEPSLEGGPAIARPNPCVLAGSHVIAAPDDSSELFALDAATGGVLWTAPRPAPQSRILAVDQDRVLLSGERLWAFDRESGAMAPEWGADVPGGAGQGAVAGELIFWPLGVEVMLIERATGKPTGQALPLPGAGGANLVVAGGGAAGEVYVVAAGANHMTAYRQTAVANERSTGAAPLE